MGAIAIAVPDFPDAQLIFNADETREILRFFWPARSGDINKATVGNGLRRFAQTVLIVAVDASYPIGFLKSLLGGAATPPALARLVGKLAWSGSRNWFSHATAKDLRHARIARAALMDVTWQYATQFTQYLEGVEIGTRRPNAPNLAHNGARARA